MKKVNYISTFILMFLLAGCSGFNHDHSHHDSGGHEESETGKVKEEVHLLQKQMDVMNIQLGQFQYLNLSTTVKSNGQLDLPPQNQASLSSVLGGRVVEVFVIEGEQVQKGQALASLEHPDFVELQEQYLKAKSHFAFLELNYQREKSLFADSVISIKSFQQMELEYNLEMAEVAALEAKLKMLDVDIEHLNTGKLSETIPVKSPIDGFVRHVEINIGKYVQPQQEMFEITDNEHIHIDLMVYEKDLDKVQEGQQVIFSLANQPDRVFEGTVFSVGKSFEQQPKAMVVHAEIENKEGNLLPGMYVDARIITEEGNVRALPNDAIVSDGGLDYIFVLSENENHVHEQEDGHHHEQAHEDEFIFKLVEVNTGASDIGFTETVPVVEVSDSSRVVTKGAYYLLAEMKKGEGGHGHHH